MTSKKFFTLEEANSMVPQLLKVVPRIQELASSLKENYPDVRKAWEKAQFNGGSREGVPYLNSALKLNKMVEELESIGVILKGISKGLVDFPSMREGREVYLCWKNPEEKIGYWHELDSGYAGRRPL